MAFREPQTQFVLCSNPLVDLGQARGRLHRCASQNHRGSAISVDIAQIGRGAGTDNDRIQTGRCLAMNLAQSLLFALKDHGVRQIFGIPGDFVLPFFKVIEDSAILPLYTLSHEPAVGFAADAAARISAAPGVAVVTYGAGALNMVNAVAGAYAEKSPLVVISGGPGEESRAAAGCCTTRQNNSTRNCRYIGRSPATRRGWTMPRARQPTSRACWRVACARRGRFISRCRATCRMWPANRSLPRRPHRWMGKRSPRALPRFWLALPQRRGRC